MNPLRAWNRFWFGPISARPLGVFRIIFGILVLAHLAFISVELDYWYTDAGLLQGDQARVVAGPLRYSPLLWVQDPVSVRCVVGVVAAVAVAFVLGWRTRIMGVLLYLGVLSLYHRNISSNCGPDQLMTIVSFYMMLSPCGAALSLDARRVSQRRGTVAEPLIVPWAQRLLQIQLCLIYLASAAFKCHGSAWLGGTAIHFILFNREVRQSNLEWLANYPVVISVLTQSALLVEFALAFL
ncbi:MAG: HTTM domain-containing protein, partial [Isosphaeraceae bacterium]